MTPQKQEDSRGHCENCGVILQGVYCHACGQLAQTSFRFFGAILMELLDNLFSYDSRVYRTLIPLMTRPGYVCNEYLAGRRASYLPPFRLYLFASIMFFLLAPMVTDVSISPDASTGDIHATVIREEIRAELKSAEKDNGIINLTDADIDKSDINVNLSFLSDKQNRALREKLEKSTENNAADLMNATLNNLPTMMFLLLPIFALTLKLFYLFSKRYYMEHVVVVLYSQSYLFFMLLFVLALDNGHDFLADRFPALVLLHTIGKVIITLSVYWIPVHLFLIQKRVYGQSIALTLGKFVATALTYFGLLGITLALAVIWGVVTV